ncbi:MAG TPA: aminodeoxychorismate lyase [Steroidobacteraceae bacterium]|nr:aminodeoxychorismate lyase [Steroidobacteraceae bacterium]
MRTRALCAAEPRAHDERGSARFHGRRRPGSGARQWCRGDLAHTAVALDRGLHFGDGLFETIACRRGRARFLALHLDRLSRGCERLRIEMGDVSAIRREIEQAAATARGDSLIKLIVTRGPAVARGYGWSGTESATRVLLRYAWPQEDATAWLDGVRVQVARTKLGENAALAGMKHLNRLEQVLARAEVSSKEAAELLLFSSSGLLISGVMSNVFIVRNGRLATPRLDLCGVAGVMRRVVLREAAKAGLAAEEGALSEHDLNRAEEVFVTNARIGVWPIRAIGSRALAIGEVTRRVQALIAPALENPVDA